MQRLFGYLGNTGQKTVDLIRADATFYLIVALYTVAGMLLLEMLESGNRGVYGMYLATRPLMFLLLMPLATIVVDAVYVIHRFDRRRLLAFSRAFSARRMAWLLSGMLAMAGFMIFQGTFTSIKNVLPLLHAGSFPYDRVQADIDAFLHFGVDPWRLLYTLGMDDLVRRALEWNYNVVWFLLCFGGLFFVLTSPKARAVRSRYMVTFLLVWVVCGNLLAGLFLSAGPAYYGFVTGDETRFAQQLAFLAESGDSFSSAANFQAYLWTQHHAGTTGLGSGISAFPSVHVALVAMNMFFLAEKSRRLGFVAGVYLALIVASSVYLAWHYAIDGYAAILAVAAIHSTVRYFFGAAEPTAPINEERGEPFVTAS